MKPRNPHFPLENNYKSGTLQGEKFISSSIFTRREFHADRGSISTAMEFQRRQRPYVSLRLQHGLASRVPELSNARVNAFRGEESPCRYVHGRPRTMVARTRCRRCGTSHDDTKLPLSLQDSRFPALHNSPLNHYLSLKEGQFSPSLFYRSISFFQIEQQIIE